MKNQKGITLVALIITIIVMLILAGISLTWTIGDDGIMSKAEKAESSTNAVQILEKADVIKASLALDMKLDDDRNIIVVQEFKERLAEEVDGKIEGNKVIVDDKYTVIVKNPNLDIEVVEGDVANHGSLVTASYNINSNNIIIETSLNNDENFMDRAYNYIIKIQDKTEQMEKEILRYYGVKTIDEIVMKQLEANFGPHPECDSLEEWGKSQDIIDFANSKGINGTITKEVFYQFLYGTTNKELIVEKLFYNYEPIEKIYNNAKKSLEITVKKDGMLLPSFNKKTFSTSAGITIDNITKGIYEISIISRYSSGAEVANEKIIVNK